MKKLVMMVALMFSMIGTAYAKDVGNGWDLAVNETRGGLNYVTLIKSDKYMSIGIVYDGLSDNPLLYISRKDGDQITWFISSNVKMKDGEKPLANSNSCFQQQTLTPPKFGCIDSGLISMRLARQDADLLLDGSALMVKYQTKKSMETNSFYTSTIDLRGSKNALTQMGNLVSLISAMGAGN